jgi:hypothetical protein
MIEAHRVLVDRLARHRGKNAGSANGFGARPGRTFRRAPQCARKNKLRYSAAAEAIATPKNVAGSHHPCIARIPTMIPRY